MAWPKTPARRGLALASGAHIYSDASLNMYEGYLDILVTGAASAKRWPQSVTSLSRDNLPRGNLWAIKWGVFERGDIADTDQVRLVLDKYKAWCPHAVCGLCICRSSACWLERRAWLALDGLTLFQCAGVDPGGQIGEAHDPETHLISLVLAAARSGKPDRIFGLDYDTRDGNCIRDDSHVTISQTHMCARWNTLSLEVEAAR